VSVVYSTVSDRRGSERPIRIGGRVWLFCSGDQAKSTDLSGDVYGWVSLAGRWHVTDGQSRVSGGQESDLERAMLMAEALIDEWGLPGGYVVGPDGMNRKVVEESELPAGEPTVELAGWHFTTTSYRAARVKARAEEFPREVKACGI